MLTARKIITFKKRVVNTKMLKLKEISVIALGKHIIYDKFFSLSVTLCEEAAAFLLCAVADHVRRPVRHQHIPQENAFFGI